MPTGILGLTTAPPAKAHRVGATDDKAGRKGQRTTKRKAAEGGEAEDMPDLAELVKFTAMLTLSNAQSSRALTGITMDTFITKKDQPLCTAIKKATEAYAAHVKQSKNNAAEAPPHTWAWQAIVEYYATKLKDTGKTEEAKVLEAYVQDIVQQPAGARAEYIALYIRHCKLGKCFDSTQSKLQISVTPGSPPEAPWKIIKHSMITMDSAILKQGQAPRTNLERQVQTLLTNVTENMQED
eukprot:TRINITY_DN35684_c0_g1_i1.p2 TRINITY_DN35684_c0_g1~~TRINITY_DN35684_c0_g1_i1.p2  ORF type:complete len:239 (+),score=55.57 TRINITY_DN35684_c0_g1_i1:256-972(+)